MLFGFTLFVSQQEKNKDVILVLYSYSTQLCFND